MLTRPISIFVATGAVLGILLGCSVESSEERLDLSGTTLFPAPGALSASSGSGSFRFGAASAATQIEDQNPNTDWYVFTKPTSAGGLGRGAEFVGEAAKGYTLALQDVDLLSKLHVDAYRFSIEWARVEPVRNHIDEQALQHYSDLIDALLAHGIKPMITVHHFSNPIWIDDPRDPNCANGPNDKNLCGLGHPEGAPQVIQEFAQFAKLLAERFGDRVDEWATVNEPVVYLLLGYGVGQFPPGESHLLKLVDEFMPIARNYLAASAAMYHAIKDADKIDSDGDGMAATVGITMSVADWVSAKDNKPSDDPIDIAGRERLLYAFHYLFVDSLVNGTFDRDLDGNVDEEHADWKGTIDWLGLQYYYRAGVTGTKGLLPVVGVTPCFSQFDFGACIPPIDPTYCVPVMGYESYAPGIFTVLKAFSDRYPSMPLVVTESGIATVSGVRRAENIVRTLDEIARARASGVDVRGYYHWSLTDNFEWALGFKPRFGLYRLDYNSYTRMPSDGAGVFEKIAGARRITPEQRADYGGDKEPMTPEGPGVGANGLCLH